MKTLFSILILVVSINFIYAQGNYNLEWESPISERCSTAFLVHLEKNNQVADVYTLIGMYPNLTYKVYDGATHNLKYTLIPNLSDTSNLDIGEEVNAYNTLDVNNDSIYELINEKRCGASGQGSAKYKILNGTNAQ